MPPADTAVCKCKVWWTADHTNLQLLPGVLAAQWDADVHGKALRLSSVLRDGDRADHF